MLKKITVALAAFAVVAGLASAPAAAAPADWGTKARNTLAYHLNPPVITAENRHMVGKTTPLRRGQSKVAPPKTPHEAMRRMSTGYQYVAGYQNFTSGTLPVGFQVNATVNQPVLMAGDDHSLMEISVHNETSPGDEQIFEFGQAVAPAALGGSNVKLFVASWTDSIFNGWNAGFTDWGGTAPNVGDVLTAGVARCFKVQYSGSAWWAYYGPTCTTGDWVGYITHATAGWPAGFNVTKKSQAFGEVHINSDPTTTDMGNGLDSSNASAAYIASTSNISSPIVTSSMTQYATCAGWTLNTLSARTWRYGGPGGC